MKPKHSLKDAYKEYYNNPTVDYTTYRIVIEDYYKGLRDLVIENKKAKLPNGLGHLEVQIRKRNFKKKRINYPASLREKRRLIDQGITPREAGSSEGASWLIYYTDDTFYRIVWDKSKVKSRKNLKSYKLLPAFTFRRNLSKHLKTDDLNTIAL